MHLMKYTDGWTRRHFLGQVGKGVFAAGVLSPLIDVIGRHGTVEAAYPPELLSIEAYTKGKLKPGHVLNAENVETANMVAMFVGQEDAIKLFRQDAALLEPKCDLARTEPAIDQNSAMIGGDERAVSGTAAAEHRQTEHAAIKRPRFGFRKLKSQKRPSFRRWQSKNALFFRSVIERPEQTNFFDATKGKEIHYSPETRLPFTPAAPVEI